jgi:hypothetical protein
VELLVSGSDQADDPVLVRRARYASWSAKGLRAGYLFLAVAVVAFIVGFPAGFPQATVIVSVVGLVGACVILPPAIVTGYAVKAAEREDRSGRT